MSAVYDGYLLKIGSWTFPHRYIQVGTYKCTPNQHMDLDSNRNTLGDLNRGVMLHTKTKIEFKTTPMQMDEQITLMGNMMAAWIAAGAELEQECDVEYYNPRTNTYDTAHVYFPDIPWEINDANATNIYYGPTRIAFTEK